MGQGLHPRAVTGIHQDPGTDLGEHLRLGESGRADDDLAGTADAANVPRTQVALDTVPGPAGRSTAGGRVKAPGTVTAPPGTPDDDA
nr:hypothetical protein [Streptomyces angustmyceticus]